MLEGSSKLFDESFFSESSIPDSVVAGVSANFIEFFFETGLTALFFVFVVFVLVLFVFSSFFFHDLV